MATNLLRWNAPECAEGKENASSTRVLIQLQPLGTDTFQALLSHAIAPTNQRKPSPNTDSRVRRHVGDICHDFKVFSLETLGPTTTMSHLIANAHTSK